MSSFNRPSRTQLISDAQTDINARVTGVDSRLRRSFAGAFAAMFAGALDALYGALQYVSNQIIPDSADSDHLARWASFWGVTPKTATAAVGSAISAAGGVNGTPVPSGTLLQRSDQTTYVTTALAAVAGGTVTVAITAQNPGSAGSNAAGVLLNLVSPIAGVVGPFTVVADMEGNDAETNPALLARLEARVQTPPTGGGPGDYVQWALSQPGVTRAWEYPNWNGLGTVGVTFVFDGRADIFPLAGDLTAMQAFLDSVAPITAVVTAFALTALPVNFTIHLVPSNGATQAAVTAELQAWMARVSVPNTSLLQSGYDAAIDEAQGVTDYTVAVPAGDVAVGAGELATLGVITWA